MNILFSVIFVGLSVAGVVADIDNPYDPVVKLFRNTGEIPTIQELNEAIDKSNVIVTKIFNKKHLKLPNINKTFDCKRGHPIILELTDGRLSNHQSVFHYKEATKLTVAQNIAHIEIQYGYEKIIVNYKYSAKHKTEAPEGKFVVEDPGFGFRLSFDIDLTTLKVTFQNFEGESKLPTDLQFLGNKKYDMLTQRILKESVPVFKELVAEVVAERIKDLVTEMGDDYNSD